MQPKKYHVLGVMSGTSLDGLDVVRVSFTYAELWNYEILEAHTYPYTQEWIDRLSNAFDLSAKEIDQLDKDYTDFLAEQLRPYIQSTAYPSLDFVSSHGHTLFHQPDEGMTLQIGNLPTLAKQLQKKVICDFRTADVALGGQGAPLVPGGEIHLFSSYAACLNLGGFANISFLDDEQIHAYDLCGVNIVLNYWANALGLPYDNKGKIARKGVLIPALKRSLDDLSFYHLPPPKSLGKEWVLSEVLPLMEKYSSEGIENLLHTYVVHAVEIITQHLPKKGKTLVTGGGAFHDFLIEKMNQQSITELIIPSQEMVEFKEALIFAFLGILRDRGENNCLSSVTGAKQDHSSGKIFTF